MPAEKRALQYEKANRMITYVHLIRYVLTRSVLNNRYGSKEECRYFGVPPSSFQGDTRVTVHFLSSKTMFFHTLLYCLTIIFNLMQEKFSGIPYLNVEFVTNLLKIGMFTGVRDFHVHTSTHTCAQISWTRGKISTVFVVLKSNLFVQLIDSQA